MKKLPRCYVTHLELLAIPRGALFHKSIVLHANMICLPDYFHLAQRLYIAHYPDVPRKCMGVTYASSMKCKV
ncbi:MAG: hypothetical protein CM15mP4_3980 [Candidatus Neomarinimicrobiota bacterium]|nr:MAG: hypothetical protein CM15mP4_3980 [Candidatus Neomarinimicrobiota bacterium]